MDVRRETSQLRGSLTAVGVEWDLSWSLDRLREEMVAARQRSGRNLVKATPARVRHLIIYLEVDKLVVYERPLLVGMFKVRLTVSSSSRRTPVVWECKNAFPSGLCVPKEDAGFKILIPFIRSDWGNAETQFAAWRIEFEILHRFPAAPLFSIVGRVWVDPLRLLSAKAVDVVSVRDLTTPCVRIELGAIACSRAGVSLFRSAAICVLCVVRLTRRLAAGKLADVKNLDAQIRHIQTRNANERQTLQLEVMMQTVGVMTKFLEQGGLSVGGRTGLDGPAGGSVVEHSVVELAVLDEKISTVSRSVESLRSEILTALIARQDIPPERPRVKESEREEVDDAPLVPTVPVRTLLTNWWNPGEKSKEGMASSTERSKEGMAMERSKEGMAGGMERSKEGMAGGMERSKEEGEIGGMKEGTSFSPPIPPPLLASSVSTPSSSKLSAAPLIAAVSMRTVRPSKPVEEESEAVVEPDETDVVIEEEPEAEVKPKAKVLVKKAMAKKPVSVKPVPVKSVPVKNSAKSPTGKKSPPPLKSKSPTSPAKKKAASPKAPPTQEELIKARMLAVAKFKASEAKRAAEIQRREKEILSLKRPPIDKVRFPGMPGPPPFKPKALPPPAVLPSVLAPTPQDDEQEEQEEQDGRAEKK